MIINTISKKRSSHIKSKKQKIFVAKVIEASDGFYYRQNLRPQAQILAKRPAGATGGHAYKRNFASCFLFRNRLSMQIFIKIWYTENNIVKN